MSARRPLWPLWLMRTLVALLGVGIAAAQAQNPFIEAARESAAVAPSREPAVATAVVRTFIDGCVAHEGEAMRTVDWAINQGFEPVDAHVGLGATVLAGRPGTVLALPGSGAGVLLAIDLDKRCTVWVERGDGPAVRTEFGKAMGALAARGVRVQPALERSVERAGAWRLQLQMRVRRAGGLQDFDVGSVTTLTAQPAVQVLSVAPLPPGEPPPPAEPHVQSTR